MSEASLGSPADILVAILLLIGAFFGLVGSWGLVKLPDAFTRLHAPTKASTLGIGSVLLASIAYFWLIVGNMTVHELMITIFVLLTAPVAAHLLAKAALHRRLPSKAPMCRPGEAGAEWSTFAPSDLPHQEPQKEDPVTGTPLQR